jgi:hypothetical protein
MPTASGAPLRKESADGNLGVSSPRGRQVPFAPTSRREFFRKLLGKRDTVEIVDAITMASTEAAWH